jgi:hypothetical protein
MDSRVDWYGCESRGKDAFRALAALYWGGVHACVCRYLAGLVGVITG